MAEESDRGGSRGAIDAAVVQLVAEHGLDGVSVRKVAARAGVSPGLVQHHYPTKQSLVVAAMGHVGATVQQRFRAADEVGPPAARLRALASQVVPLDAARAVEARVWLAFVARAAVDPVIGHAHAASWQQLEDAIAQLLAAHHGRGGPGPVDQDAAALLLAGLDGLAATAVSEPVRLPAARTRALADRLVDQALDAAAAGR